MHLRRWLSPDPLAGSVFDPQSLNRYAYVLNNPTTLTDPLGLDDGNCSDFWYWVSHAECRWPPPPNAGCVAYGTEGCITPPYYPFPGPLPPFPFPSPGGGGGGGSSGGGTAGSSPTTTITSPAMPLTASVNVDFNFQLGPIFFTFARSLIIDSKGCVAIGATSGVGGGAGTSASFGVSVSTSTAETVQDLSGPFATVSGSVVPEGVGVGGEGAVFGGPSPHGPVVGSTAGPILGAGVPISGASAVTATKVTPVTHLPGGSCRE